MPQALVLADVAHPSIAQRLAKVARAQAIVVATPIYKAAYSGVLKLFLDLLPQTAFKGKTVLPMATGGSPNHAGVPDYAPQPVLQSLVLTTSCRGVCHRRPGSFCCSRMATS